MSKKDKKTVINNIKELNLEIDCDKLADAIVKAEEKSEKKRKEEEKRRKPSLKHRVVNSLMQGGGIALIALALVLFVFSIINIISVFKFATFGLFLIICGKTYYIVGKTDDAQLSLGILSFLIALLSIVTDVLTKGNIL